MPLITLRLNFIADCGRISDCGLRTELIAVCGRIADFGLRATAFVRAPHFAIRPQTAISSVLFRSPQYVRSPQRLEVTLFCEGRLVP